MSVNYTDFDKIWASTSPLTPYEFSEAQYKEGWNFVGVTPPSRQMWDKFMQQADEKMQYLYNHESVPVGHEYFTFNPNIPQGSLPLFGGEYSRETYSALWNWVQQQTGYLKTEAEWQQIYTTNAGNVPYYSDGDGSTTFRVPSLKCWVKGANGTVSEVGSYLQAGLPNITGSAKLAGVYFGDSTASGSFSLSDTTGTRPSGYASSNSATLNIDSSRSSSIYGNSTTVQPPSIVGMWLVKAYGVVEDTGQIDEQQYLDDRMADLKNVYLPANYLPLSGGTMTGNIGLSATRAIQSTVDNSTVYFRGGSGLDKGAYLELHGKDESNMPGAFYISARTSADIGLALVGSPNGSLIWSGKKITVNSNIEDVTFTTDSTNVLQVGSYCHAYRCGCVVTIAINAQIKGGLTSGNDILTGLPRPKYNLGACICTESASLRILINTNGQAKVDGNGPSSNTWFNGCITYITTD